MLQDMYQDMLQNAPMQLQLSFWGKLSDFAVTALVWLPVVMVTGSCFSCHTFGIICSSGSSWARAKMSWMALQLTQYTSFIVVSCTNLELIKLNWRFRLLVSEYVGVGYTSVALATSVLSKLPCVHLHPLHSLHLENFAPQICQATVLHMPALSSVRESCSCRAKAKSFLWTSNLLAIRTWQFHTVFHTVSPGLWFFFLRCLSLSDVWASGISTLQDAHALYGSEWSLGNS